MVAYDDIRKEIALSVDVFRRENPLSPGISREDLRASIGRLVRPETFRAALEELAREKKIDVQGELVRPAGSTVLLDSEETLAKQQIEGAFAQAGLAVPDRKRSPGEVERRSETRRTDSADFATREGFTARYAGVGFSS